MSVDQELNLKHGLTRIIPWLEFAPPMEFNNKHFLQSSLDSVNKIAPSEIFTQNNLVDYNPIPSLGEISNSLVQQNNFDNSI